MHNFEATNGYRFAPSDNAPDDIVIEQLDSDDSRWILQRHYVEVLWRYFENDEAAPEDGSVTTWGRIVVFAFDEKGLYTGLTLKVIRQHRPVEVSIDEEQVTALRELHDWLGTDEAKATWIHRPVVVARAMLSVDNSPEQIEAIWSDEVQRTLWLERAKAAIGCIDPNAQ